MLSPFLIYLCNKYSGKQKPLMWFGAVLIVASTTGAAFATTVSGLSSEVVSKCRDVRESESSIKSQSNRVTDKLSRLVTIVKSNVVCNQHELVC